MGKFHSRGYRKDTLQDHKHSLGNGEFTGGMCAKPSKDGYGMHTHLYEWEERTCETTPAHDTPDHVHTSEIGDTSGPMPMDKLPGDPWQDNTDKTQHG